MATIDYSLLPGSNDRLLGQAPSSRNVPGGFQPTNANLLIGTDQNQNYFSGVIDELAIWNRALTPEEIQQHYQNGGLSRVLTMVANGSGTVTPPAGTHSYPVGTTIDITATAALGWQFVGWTGTVADNASTNTTVVMDAAKTVTANFSERPAPTPTPTPTLIEGLTYEAKGVILGGVTITLDGVSSVIGDGNGYYRIATSATGSHTVVASKTGFRSQTRSLTVDNTTATYTLDFKGADGLVPDAPDLSYVLACVHAWKFPPEGLGLDLSKVLAVVNAWRFPL